MLGTSTGLEPEMFCEFAVPLGVCCRSEVGTVVGISPYDARVGLPLETSAAGFRRDEGIMFWRELVVPFVVVGGD